MSRHTTKRPLAAYLVAAEHFASEDEAGRWIMAGQVLVNGQRVDKPGAMIPAGARIEVRGRRRYASRGGYKLAAALDHFAVPVAGRVALDCGASTGGFTDCLLQRGASLVYAIDAGYGQLAGRLRADPHVHTLERTNLGDLSPGMLTPRPQLITLDLSYLSLTLALPQAAPLLAPAGDILALFKPLFEVEDAEAGRTGRVNDQALIVAALRRVLDAGAASRLAPLGAVKLALQPRHGIFEFMLHLTNGPECPPWRYGDNSLAQVAESRGIGAAEEEQLDRGRA